MQKRILLSSIFLFMSILLMPSCVTHEKVHGHQHAHASGQQGATNGQMTAQPSERGRNIFLSKEMMIMQNLISSLRPSRTLYGRVIDQYGNPVEKADVTISYPVLSLNSTFGEDVKFNRTITDKKGNWKCRIPIHLSFFLTPEVYQIRKYGYKWEKNKDPNCKLSNVHAYERNNRTGLNSPFNRLVNVVQNLGEMSYIEEGVPARLKLGLHEGRAKGYMNLLHSGSSYSKNDKRNLIYWQPGRDFDENSLYDLCFHVKRSPEGGRWELEVIPCGKKGGIQKWNAERVSAAPEEGYGESFKMKLLDGEICRVLLYARTRDFPLYSEIHMTVYASNPESQQTQSNDGGEAEKPAHWVNVQLDETLLNPFGKRWLQWDECYYEPNVRNYAYKIVRKQLDCNLLPDEEDIKKKRVIPDYTKKD